MKILTNTLTKQIPTFFKRLEGVLGKYIKNKYISVHHRHYLELVGGGGASSLRRTSQLKRFVCGGVSK